MKSLIIISISSLCLLLMNCSDSANQSASSNISGVVRNSDGYVMPDIEVTLYSQNKYYTSYTDAKGKYSFKNVANGIPILRPTQAGYYYKPEQMQLLVPGTNLSNINFTATLPDVYLFFNDGDKFYKYHNYYLRSCDILTYFYDAKIGQYVLNMYSCYLESSDKRQYGMYFYILLGKNPQVSNSAWTYAYAEIWNYVEKYIYTAGTTVGKGSGTVKITKRTSNQITGTFGGFLIPDKGGHSLNVSGKFNNKLAAGALKKCDIKL